MLAHLAQASRRPARSWLSVVPRRHYAAGPDAADPFKEGPSYAVWLRNEGVKYKEPHRPKNWLGGEVPFPLNPTFKPPTPISDAARTAIWNDYMLDPVKSNVRVLAQRYGLSIARVDAILRLKGLEAHWKKVTLTLSSQNKQLQTGFLKGMEYALGVSNDSSTKTLRGPAYELGEDAIEADAVSESTKSLARDRYQRLFWEPVPEGKAPIVPGALVRALEDGGKSTAALEAAKLKRLRHLRTETEAERTIDRPGRPTMRFVDIGMKFLDVDDRLRRVNVAKRRSLLKRRRRVTGSASAQGEPSESPAASV
ncbi:eukaryotic mitochondrial regulator protein-domain-containing protein [Trametes maxima]|nr:eukaryotic mitochondrial regulator protein-domain-containing protein [Trametes maxima]